MYVHFSKGLPLRLPFVTPAGLPQAMWTPSLCMPCLILPCWASFLSEFERLSSSAGFLAMRAAGVFGAQLFSVSMAAAARVESVAFIFILV